MKKTVFLLVVIFCTFTLFSQNGKTKENVLTEFEKKTKLQEDDFNERTKANQKPIIKVMVDTLASDSLIQYYYHNGNLYYQVTFKNGKENGWLEQYHPNGQLEERRFYINGFSQFDSCNYVSFDRFGDTAYTSICNIYNKKPYSFQTTYFLGSPLSLMIYNEGTLVAEFRWLDKKWIKHDYHCRSVKYAPKLLRFYKKKLSSKSG